jgi:hypothetical protein
VQADRVRRAAPGDEEVAADIRLRQLTGELQDEAVEALVGDEQIRAQTDGRNLQALAGRVSQRLLELGKRLRPREGARRAARPERREPCELDAAFDAQVLSPSSKEAARSTSPAPIVTTRSPLRAVAAR